MLKIEVLKEIQQVLKAHGHYAGICDGKIGLQSLVAFQQMSKKACMEIQALLGLPQDGYVGVKTNTAFNEIIPLPILTQKNLLSVYPGANVNFIPIINSMVKEWGIENKVQLCMFLANVLVESNGFNALRENLNYSAEQLFKVFNKRTASLARAQQIVKQGPMGIAEHIYGGRFGNGIGNSDAWRYRGGGLIQTTFRDNYTSLSKALGIDLVNYPAHIVEPEIAVKSALYYWSSKNCSKLSNDFNLKECRRVINGGLNGFSDVEKIYSKCWKYLF